MANAKNEISASEFKKYFLSLVDEVKNKHSSFIITKRKIPVAQVIPLEDKNTKKKSYFGFLKGSIKINDDIVNTSFEDDWESNSEANG
jgi:prevent-host-death family protein